MEIEEQNAGNFRFEIQPVFTLGFEYIYAWGGGAILVFPILPGFILQN